MRVVSSFSRSTRALQGKVTHTGVAAGHWLCVLVDNFAGMAHGEGL